VAAGLPAALLGFAGGGVLGVIARLALRRVTA
jgi:hypothetical protein